MTEEEISRADLMAKMVLDSQGNPDADAVFRLKEAKNICACYGAAKRDLESLRTRSEALLRAAEGYGTSHHSACFANIGRECTCGAERLAEAIAAYKRE